MKDIDWKDCETLEDRFRRAIKEGLDAEAALLVKNLPDDRKVYYRKLWKELKGTK